MASKQLYEGFYALLEPPKNDIPANRDTDVLPHEQEISPPQEEEDTEEDLKINKPQQPERRPREVLDELFTEFNINLTLVDHGKGAKEVPGLNQRIATLLVRSKLEEMIRSDEIPDITKSYLERELSGSMDCPAIADTRVSRAEAIAAQEELLDGGVGFADLPKIFLPGDIVYTADTTPIKDTLYEQCWMVAKCELVTEHQRRGLLVNGVKWCVDVTSDNGWYLASCEVLIYAYDGIRVISLDTMGVVPLGSLPTEEQMAVSDRMIARGRQYLEMSQVEVRYWQYHGPASCTPHHSASHVENSEMLLFRKLSHWMWWNDVICERVVLDNLVLESPIQTLSSSLQRLGPVDKSNINHDKMFMICSGSIFVRTLPDFAWASIFIDHLRPVKWEECELTQDGLSAAASLSLLPSCRGDVQPSQSFFRSNGQIVILRTRMYFISPVVAGVAENARRPLVWLDLLDVIHHQEDYIQQLQKIFEDVQKIEAYLYLVNFAPLVAKRSYEDRRGCVEIRRFLDLLRSYHGVVFICLSRHDETDPVLDTMGPVELKLHDCNTANPKPRHMCHFDTERPSWKVAMHEGSGNRKHDHEDYERERIVRIRPRSRDSLERIVRSRPRPRDSL
ncbi:hypothetical protein CGMCC3_g3909 [Colletotrichum fructicola]|nr:uncharacterized protein CGMCC3_g3909 [Colletotrichum fructicola]KAE9580129.1 hypothetical protein CGMCC3_g3909 [Colletotrichum fructicola]